ncbi:hypothetical protein Csp1_01130 [Corynebacterium provencense]|uniref:Uncharacterized protein n=1 Tax=Corynebacterium provencense TaxID=1737425 RepID=A0A2Z3YNT6_9CORY|nr:hypothetical protein [Corynebacterium provencense]AWT24941.1 hypothetical protein Csp1_01130 [Corynebacterium provencense]
MTRPNVRTFADVSAVTRTGPQRHRADLDPLWGFGGNPNGGYLQTTMARAALDATGREVKSWEVVYLPSAETLRVTPDQGPSRA